MSRCFLVLWLNHFHYPPLIVGKVVYNYVSPHILLSTTQECKQTITRQ